MPSLMCLASPITNVIGAPKCKSGSCTHVMTRTTPFLGKFAFGRLGLARWTCIQNLKLIASPVMKIWKAMQNVENKVVWWLGSLKVTEYSTIW